MTLAEQDKRQMLHAISDVPLTFTHGGTTYTDAATMGSLVIREPNEVGGFLPDPDLTITTTLQKLDSSDALVNRFSTAPTRNDTVTVNGTTYRVEATTEDELTSALVLDLMSASK